MKRLNILNKGTQKHKFLTFAERLSSVSVDIFRAGKGADEREVPEGALCYFAEDLDMWADRNLTAEFHQMYIALKPMTMTLPLLLLNLKSVVEILEKCLNETELVTPTGTTRKDMHNSAIEPTFALVQTLARDTRQHLTEFVPRLLRAVLHQIANGSDTDVLEQGFQTVAYMFKYLQRQLLADVTSLYKDYTMYLEHKKPFVREFAAESFSFLIRKLEKSQLDELFRAIFTDLQARDSNTQSLQDGLVQLFFQSVKGVQTHFNNHVQHIFTTLLRQLQPYAHDEDETAWHTRSEVINDVVAEMCEHARAEDSGPVLECFTALFTELLARDIVVHERHMRGLLAALTRWITHRRGSRVTDKPALIALLQRVVTHWPAVNTATALIDATLEAVSALIKVTDQSTLHNTHLSPLVALCFNKLAQAPQHLFQFATTNAAKNNFGPLMLDHVLKLVDVAQPPEGTLPFLVSLLSAVNWGMLATLSSQRVTNRRIKDTRHLSRVLGSIVAQYKGHAEDDEQLWNALQVLQVLQEGATHLPGLQTLYTQLLNTTRTDIAVPCLIAAVLLCAHTLLTTHEQTNQRTRWLNHVLAALHKHSHHAGVVHAASVWITAESVELVQHDAALRTQFTPQLIALLFDNLAQHSTDLRRNTLELLQHLQPCTESYAVALVELCSHVEYSPLTATESKVVVKHLDNVREYLIRRSVNSTERALICSYMIGTLHIRFAPIYPATNQVLVALAQQDFAQFWELFLHHLQRGFEAQDSFLKQQATPANEVIEEDEDENEEDDDQPPALETPAPETKDEHVTPFSESVHQGNARSDVQALTTHLDRLWAVLLAMPQTVERHSRVLVPLFLDFYRRYYDASVTDESGSDSGSEGVTRVSDKKLVHGKLCHFLSLFAQFKNAKSVHRASTLLAIYRTLLQRNHIKIQQLALQCIVCWKFEYITPYKEHLERLIDEKSFREELAVLKFGSSADMQTDGLVLPQHRAALAPIVIDILYPKLTARKARTGKKTLRQKRGAILNYLSLLHRSELEHLFALLLAPFQALLADSTALVADIDLAKQEGYLNMLEDLVDHFGQALLPFVPQLFGITLHLLQHAIESRATTKSDKQALIENLALRRVIALMDHYRSLRTLFDSHRAALSAVLVHELTRWERSLSGTSSEQQTPAVLEWCHVLLSVQEEVSHMHVAVVLEVQSVFMNALARTLLHVQHHVSQEALLRVIEQLLELRVLNTKWDLVTAHIVALLTSLETFIARITAVKSLPRHQSRVVHTDHSRALTARSLSVISQLTTLAADYEQSHRIINLLLPFLKPQHRLSEDTTRDILTAVKQLLEKMRADNPHKRNYLQPIAALLERDYPAPLREMLAHVLSALVPRASKVMTGLTAIDRSQLGVPNYEARLQAYATLASEAADAPLPEYSYEEWLPVMHIALHDLAYSTDLSLRTQALHMLTALITHTVQHRTHVTVTALLNVLSPAIRRQMNSSSVSARGEYLALLVELIRALPEQYAELVPLLSSDDEANFFYNIVHLQVHRRQRALVRFASYCESGAMKKNVLMNIFYPLIRRTMLETPSTQHHLIDECVKAIAAISKCVDWHAYKRIILTHLALLRTIRSKAKAVQQKKHARVHAQNNAALMSLDKPVIRLIVQVVDNFHFDIDTSKEFGDQLPNLEDVQRALAKTDRLLSTQTEASSVQPVSGKQRVLERGEDEQAPEDEAEDDEAELDGEDEDEEMEESRATNTTSASDLTRKQRMQHELLNTVLPELYKYLKDEHTREVMRVPVALAIVKLLKLMPLQIFNLQIPKLMTEVCSTLKSRSQLARDQTRATLVQLAAVLGASHFNFIVQELVDALSRGYQVHVLGYTTHSLLKHMVEGNHVTGGEIDYCIPLLMKIMLEDIFGHVAEQKEVEKIAGSMKEAARTQSYDSFKLIGRVLNLKQSISAVLTPLSELVDAATDMEQIKKLQEIFKHLAHGLHANTSLQVTDLLVFIHRTVKTNLRAYQDQQSKASQYVSTTAIKRGEAKFWIEPEPRKRQEQSAVTTSNQHLLINFGLQVLVLTVKSPELLQPNNVEHLQLLDPFVALLHDTLNSRFDRVLVTTLKTMGYLLKMPLPAWNTRIDGVTARIFSLLEKSNAQSELAQYCFKALTVVIRDQKQHTISDKQLNLLLDHIRTDLSELANQGITFHLLKAIVSRRLLSPQIYDIMQVLSTELLLSSPLPSVRQNSQVIFMQFLLHYPLGEQRLQQHLDLLRQALTHHPYAQARGSVLEMLEQIFAHFPQEVIEGKAEYFYLPLVLALGNETDTQQRAMLSHVIKRLLQAITLNRLHALLEVTLEWFSDDTQRSLQRTAALLLGLFVEVNWKSVENVLSTVLTRVTAVITEHVQQLQDEDEEVDESSGWEQLYAVLLLLEKISSAAPQLLVSSEWQDYWANLHALLLHPHQWIRAITSRLWGLYFAQRGSKGLQPFTPRNNDLLMRPGLLFHVAQDMCKQMQSQYLTESLAEQIIKNLVFVGQLFYKHPELTAVSRAKHTDLAEEDEDNDMEDEHVTANQSEKGKKPLPPLEWIFRRLSYMARKEEGHKKRVIFQWFAAMVTQLDDLTPYLISMLNPLYRVVDNKDAAHSASEREIRMLANEVVNMIKKKVGTMPFLKAYEFVRDRVSKVRGERKEKRRIEFVVDPRKAAARKIRKNEQKKDAKNRKRKWTPTYKDNKQHHNKKQRTS